MRPAGSAVRSRPIERPSFLILSLNDVRPAHPPDPLLQASSADDEGQTLNSTCPPRTECDTVYGNSLPSLPTLYWNDVGSQTWLRQTSSPRHVALSFLDDESAPARFATEATSATTHAFLALLRLLLIIMMSKEDRSASQGTSTGTLFSRMKKSLLLSAIKIVKMIVNCCQKEKVRTHFSCRI